MSLQNCMQKKTELRYPTVMDLIADLKMFLQDPTGEYGVIRNLYENADTIFIPSNDVNSLKAASTKQALDEKTEEEADEESNGEVDPKLEKALIIGSITVAIIIGVIIIYLLGRFVGFWGGSSSPMKRHRSRLHRQHRQVKNRSARRRAIKHRFRRLKV